METSDNGVAVQPGGMLARKELTPIAERDGGTSTD
jgi:hypothetical protein